MGILLQGFYKSRPNRAVPAPSDGDKSIPWWWDHLAAQANDLRKAGFTAVWLPPVLKTSAGANSGSDGYGPFDDYDIGSKDQMGTIPTRFGTREALQRCAAILRANGLDIYLDLVEHHRSGDPGNHPFVFRYKGANGRPNAGRFPKDPMNFLPAVPRDPNLGGPAKDDFPFGRELAPINARPQGYVFNGLIDAADWVTRAIDAQGYRLDDVKGLSTDFLFPFLTRKSMAGKFAVGEFFDGNRVLVNQWVFNQQGMRGRSSAFDFPLRFILQAMCANPGRFNMADLDHAGLTGIAPFNSVTFIENHDTDLGSPVVSNKILAYAYILTSEGYPCVFYKDYSTDPGCYGLKAPLGNLIWIHEHLAAGDTLQRWKDFNLFVYERLGAPGLLVGLNNDPGGSRTVEVATNFGAHALLHDYTGHGPDVVTSDRGTALITVPRNDNGQSYVCYSRAGIGGAFAVTTQSVRQDFEGAPDLDIPPAENGKTIHVGRIWCRQNTPIHAALDMPNIAAPANAKLTIVGPDDTVLAENSFQGGAAALQGAVAADAKQTGFHKLQIALKQAPGDATGAYKLSVTYTGSHVLPADAIKPTVPHPVHNGADAGHGGGEWSEVFSLPNVAIHTHLLPNGKVLLWGRRDSPNGTLDNHFCTPQVWDPATRTAVATPQPKQQDGTTTVNLFCSGHTLLPDGRLFVGGGHWLDSQGIDQAAIYDFRTNLWTALPAMNSGRWYPTAITLPDGRPLILSGSFLGANGKDTPHNIIPQVWNGNSWHNLVSFPGDVLELYPCMHVAPDGRLFMSGPLAQSWLLDPVGDGKWSKLEAPGGLRANARRDYTPSVMYDVGKIIYIGGGNNPGEGDQPPTSAVEHIDLTVAAPSWTPTGSMHFPRRQHNATLLPDGTVLVTGGTRGLGFNDLDPGQPVHEAELWDPATGQWTVMAAEAVDRCYHSTAILLPDATVLSAGGGEYKPNNVDPNAPQDTHRDAQIYKPPYFFRGLGPQLTQAPTEVQYGETFAVETPAPGDIGRVSWLRLASTTHTNNMNQRINFLRFQVDGNTLRVTSPDKPEHCPPGHYMLFLLNKQGVPSTAKIIHIAPSQAHAQQLAMVRAPAPAPKEAFFTTEDLDQQVLEKASGTQAVLGLTSQCPYGLGACWGGAYEALKKLDGVNLVRPIANAEDSTADVWLVGDIVPDVHRWKEQIAHSANGSYHLRGVEISITASLLTDNGVLFASNPHLISRLPLRPLGSIPKVQYDRTTKHARPASAAELTAYERLLAQAQSGAAMPSVRVTGPLVHDVDGWALHVRGFTN